MGDDAELTKRASQLFDESVRELDAGTLSRLNRSRQRALAGAKRGGLEWPVAAPVAAVAAAAAVAVIVWSLGSGIDDLPPETAADFEMLLAGEDLEMLEDLDFYRWLALDETAQENGADDHVG
jgi:hypothetical protein